MLAGWRMRLIFGVGRNTASGRQDGHPERLPDKTKARHGGSISGCWAKQRGTSRRSAWPVHERCRIFGGHGCGLGGGRRPGTGIGQKPDHGQNYQGGGLMDRGVFEMTIGGDRLKDFCIDAPTAATEPMNKKGRDRAQFEIGSVEVSAGEQDRSLAFSSSSVFSADRDPTLLFDANRFDDRIWRSATGQSTSGKCQYRISRSGSC